LAKYENFTDFKTKTQVGHRFSTYELDYDSEAQGMRMLEHFAEGEFRIGPLKITRKYISISCFPQD